MELHYSFVDSYCGTRNTRLCSLHQALEKTTYVKKFPQLAEGTFLSIKTDIIVFRILLFILILIIVIILVLIFVLVLFLVLVFLF